MPTEAKRETVEELRGAIAGSTALIVSEYRGLTVTEIADIRRALRQRDVSYRVVKNRLLSPERAVTQIEDAGLRELIEAATAAA